MSEEMKKTKEGLSVEDFIERLYQSLKGAIGSRELELPEKVEVVAEVDKSDWPHRTNYGYMYYDSVVLVDINGKKGILAYGEPGGNYISRSYDGDVLLAEYSWKEKDEKQLIEEITEVLEEDSRCFSNTLLYGERSEVLVFPDYPRVLERLMRKLLIQELSDLSPQEDVKASFNRDKLTLRAWQEDQSDYPLTVASGEEIELREESVGFLSSIIEKAFSS